MPWLGRGGTAGAGAYWLGQGMSPASSPPPTPPGQVSAPAGPSPGAQQGEAPPRPPPPPALPRPHARPLLGGRIPQREPLCAARSLRAGKVVLRAEEPGGGGDSGAASCLSRQLPQPRARRHRRRRRPGTRRRLPARPRALPPPRTWAGSRRGARSPLAPAAPPPPGARAAARHGRQSRGVRPRGEELSAAGGTRKEPRRAPGIISQPGMGDWSRRPRAAASGRLRAGRAAVLVLLLARFCLSAAVEEKKGTDRAPRRGGGRSPAAPGTGAGKL